MADTVLVQHNSPLGELTIPTPSGAVFTVKPGVPTELPVEVDGFPVAGTAPGPWEPAGDGADLDDGRNYRLGPDGALQARHPGTGVLAQDDVWTVAPSSKKTPAAPAAQTPSEG